MKHLQEYINNSTVNSRIELEAKIAELERRLVEHREELANTEQRHQRQLTVVGALATAIKQTLSAVKLAVEAGEPGLVDSFWQEMKDIQDGNYDEKELLSLPTSEDGGDGTNPNPVNQGPHTHDSLVKVSLSNVKEIARDLDVSVKDVKKYGNTRQKLSWITAILEKQKETENNQEVNGKDNTENVQPVVTPPPVETNDVVDVNSTVVDATEDNSTDVDVTVVDSTEDNSNNVDSTDVDSTVVESSDIEDENDFEGW